MILNLENNIQFVNLCLMFKLCPFFSLPLVTTGLRTIQFLFLLGDDLLVSAYQDYSGRAYARQMRASTHLYMVEAPSPVIGYYTYDRTNTTDAKAASTAPTATTAILLLSLATIYLL
jgi:hypothetical protein